MASTFARSCVLSLVSGCSFVYSDTLDKKQCETNDDCPPVANATFMCTNNVCVATGSKLCTNDTDCASDQRCGFDSTCYETWGCLKNNPDWPAAPAPFHVKIPLLRVDGLPESTIMDVVTTACSSTDVTCANPVVRSDQITLDADKVLDVPFSDGFSGFVRIAPMDPTSPNTFEPTTYHSLSAQPWAGDLYLDQTASIANASLDATLAQVVGVTLEPNHVLLGLNLHDCGGRPVPNVKLVPVTTPNASFIVVGTGNLPDLTAKATGTSGAAFVMNLPTGSLQTFNLTDPTTGSVIDSFGITTQAGGPNITSYYPRFSAMQAWMKEYDRRLTTGDAGI